MGATLLQKCRSHRFPKTFQRWKKSFPPLEIPDSSVGPEKSQEGNSFWNSYIRQIKHDTVCLNEGSDPSD